MLNYPNFSCKVSLSWLQGSLPWPACEWECECVSIIIYLKLIRFSNNTGIIWKSTSPMIAPNPKDINFDNNSSEIALLFFDLPNNLLTHYHQ